MPIQFDQSTAGLVTLSPPASGTYTLQFPSGNGSADQYLSTDGAGVLSWQGLTGLTSYTAALNTASPNNTVNISSLTVTNGSTNTFACLAPNGSGAFQAQIADSTATGGNARGTYSVDLQMSRTDASQVASGGSAILLGGSGNTLSGSGVIGGGLSNAATQSASFIGGGENNSLSSASYGTILGGYGNSVTQQGGVILGGKNNVASAELQMVFGGNSTNGGTVWALTQLPAMNTIGASSTNAFIGRGFCIYYYSDPNAVSALATIDGSQTASVNNQIRLRTNSVYYFSSLEAYYEPYFPLSTVRSNGGMIRRGGAASTTTWIYPGVSSSSSTMLYKNSINDSITSSMTPNTTTGAMDLRATGSVNHSMSGVAVVSYYYVEF
jgi:hypothetical protein